MIFLILFIVIAFPIAWFISEFVSNSRAIRCSLGVIAILCCFGVAWVAAQIVRLDYNAYYGFATKELVDTTVEKLETGETETVLRELKHMQEQYRPTYENQAHFSELATKTAERIRGGNSADKEQ